MKKIITIIALGLISTANTWATGENYDLNFVVTENAMTNSGNFKVKVQIRASSTSFNLGAANFRFNYNDDALTFVDITAINFTSSPYGAMTSTGSGTGFISLNTSFVFGTGTTVTTSWTDVATVNFTIDDVTKVKRCVFRAITNTSGNTGAADDQHASLGTGGATWDEVIYNGSWSQGNGTSEAPGSTDGAKTIVVSSGSGSITEEAQCDSLRIASGATLNIDPTSGTDGSLHVLSNQVSNAGTLVVNADANGYGQYLGPAVSATIEQYVGTSAGWRHLGFPVNGDFGTLDLDVSSGTSLKNFGGGTSGNLYYYEDDQASPDWVAVPSSSYNPTTNRVGIAAYVGGSNYATSGTISWTGTTNSGSIATTYQWNDGNADATKDGWNLVANPYTCNVNMESFEDQESNIYSGYSIWDQSANSGVGAYSSYAADGATGTKYIAPGQSVWIKTASGDDNKALTFSEDLRSVSGGNVFEGDGKKSSGVDELKLSVTAASTNYTDHTVIHFRNQSSIAYDRMDIHKPKNPSPVPNIYSESTDGIELAINRFGSFDPAAVVPVSFESDQYAETYRIDLDLGATDPTWGDIYLVDKYAGKAHNLKSDGSYTFTTSQAAPTDRFLLRFSNPTVSTSEFENDDINVYAYESTIAISRLNPGDNLKVAVYNLAGQMVYEQSYGNESLVEIDTRLPKAYYIVKASDSKGIAQAETIVIQ